MTLELEQILIHIDRTLEKEESLRNKVLLKQIRKDIINYLDIKEKEKE